MNTAARNATLTAPPTVRPMPSTSDSGMPSRTVPRTIAPPEPAAGASSSGLRSLRLPPPISRHDAVAEVEHDRPGAHRDRDARGVHGHVRHELVRDGADQRAGAEREDEPDEPDRQPEPQRERPADDEGRGSQPAPQRRRERAAHTPAGVIEDRVGSGGVHGNTLPMASRHEAVVADTGGCAAHPCPVPRANRRYGAGSNWIESMMAWRSARSAAVASGSLLM